jgi:hypothetical protein
MFVQEEWRLNRHATLCMSSVRKVSGIEGINEQY